MICMNLNYMKVKESYLFADIRKRIDAWLADHSGQRILRLGIGDVTQPLTPSVIKAMHEAVEDQAHAETFHGYMPECGDPQLRSLIAQWYQKRNSNRLQIFADESLLDSRSIRIRNDEVVSFSQTTGRKFRPRKEARIFVDVDVTYIIEEHDAFGTIGES